MSRITRMLKRLQDPDDSRLGKLREKLGDIYYDVRDFFDGIYRFCYQPIGFIKTVYKFRKELLHYRPWDSGFINEMAAAMYTDMANNIEKHGGHVNHKRDAKRARVIARLLMDNEYMPHSPVLDRLQDKLHLEKIEGRVGRSCRLVNDRTPSEQRLYEKLMKQVVAVERQRKELLLKYLDKYHSKIWD